MEQRVVFLNVDPLPPQKTIMVEIGFKHNFKDRIFLNFVAYHRDIYDQSENVTNLMKNIGMEEVSFKQDLSGIKRYAICRKN